MTRVVLVVSWDIILYSHGIVVEYMGGIVGRWHVKSKSIVQINGPEKFAGTVFALTPFSS